MPVIAAALTLVGALCLFDLVISVGIIKRLREHSELLSNNARLIGPPTISVGEVVEEFAVAAIDGKQISSASFIGETLVAFFSPTCQPCLEKLPRFLDYARTVPGGKDGVVSAVIGDRSVSAAMIAELSEVATVVAEDRGGPFSTAFKASATPTLLRVEPNDTGELVVTANRVDFDQLPAKMTA